MTTEKWKREDLLSHLKEFDSIYANRPVKDNNGGMKSPHMFMSWFVVKKLKPKYLIESGVWKGLGTWFFENASPETQIISIDPHPHHRIYTSTKVDYRIDDFLKTDWSNLPKDDTLVFFDDHQNFFLRLQKCVDENFKKIMVEDNYPVQQGDCYSPKKIISRKDYITHVDGIKTMSSKDDNHFSYFEQHVSIYQEMPPIFKDEYTRWGDLWDESYPTPYPLLTDMDKLTYPTLYDERKDYTWICYIEIK